ncbi:hypothetical protein PtrSN002B_011657 [Pyrenophora tritici-repentis]|nr:hypothetical protein PtrV1_04061 [Pyrenophora tritici-repentis]KAF7451740.1 hypothetical protein A1F99_035170 [Pyrenophora tritici-repentis]KAF7575140.1 hypothetical protein PtrM4_067640 [Pyrenophora tritici-repentis]KAG9386095.1 hypothetical protein A1F94_002845 [Pyrenophora tritici-repentis]KAI0569139.1 hypothetical protein Alg130_11774 [Pyrenophora tritici-repentis]
MNVIGEAWSMMWKTVEQPRVQPVRERAAQSLQQEQTIKATFDHGIPTVDCMVRDAKDA